MQVFAGISSPPVPGFCGVLDRLSVAPRATWSLRRVCAAYTGPLVRIRRSSDNAESDFAPGVGGVLDSAAIVAWVGAGNNGFVRTWYDQSNNGYHATQTTAANQPTIVASGVWLGEVRSSGPGSGSTIGLSIPSNILSGATAASYVASFDQISTGSEAGTPINMSAALSPAHSHTPWVDNVAYEGFASTTRLSFPGYGAHGSTIVHTAIQNGSSLALWRNGVSKGSGAATFSSSAGDLPYALAPGSFSGGGTRELHLFISALSSTDRATLENDLISYWGVS